MKHKSMLWLGLMVGCATSEPVADLAAGQRHVAEVRRWEAACLAGTGEPQEQAFIVERVGRTTSRITPARARLDVACPLETGLHVGLTFRAAQDALEDERAFQVHLADPVSGWARAVRFDADSPVHVEDCSAVDVDQTRYELRGSWERRGYQPLGLWLHLPEGVDPKGLQVSWSWSRPE